MRDDLAVRTTLDIDEGVLQAAKKLALRHRIIVGPILSELARGRSRRKRNGIPILPPRRQAGLVTLEVVNRLRDRT
jgi:hypothetical protein